jgi:hypothetical protein
MRKASDLTLIHSPGDWEKNDIVETAVEGHKAETKWR